MWRKNKMATPNISRLNKARHKQGLISKINQEQRERQIENAKKEKPINEDEHNKRLELLKKIGLLKKSN